jgi:hypothetical protein
MSRLERTIHAAAAIAAGLTIAAVLTLAVLLWGDA